MEVSSLTVRSGPPARHRLVQVVPGPAIDTPWPSSRGHLDSVTAKEYGVLVALHGRVTCRHRLATMQRWRELLAQLRRFSVCHTSLVETR